MLDAFSREDLASIGRDRRADRVEEREECGRQVDVVDENDGDFDLVAAMRALSGGLQGTFLGLLLDLCTQLLLSAELHCLKRQTVGRPLSFPDASTDIPMVKSETDVCKPAQQGVADLILTRVPS